MGVQDEHIAVRTPTVRFQNLNQSVFQPYLTPINKPTMTEHIPHVKTPDVFGTHMEILAIATYYGVPVFYCCLQARAGYRWHCVKPLTSKGSFPDLSGSPLKQVDLRATTF